MDTHGPYAPPGEYRTLYADRSLSERDAQSLYKRAINDPESVTETERQLLIDLYDGEIRYNDEWFGSFLDELRDRSLLEESLLIVTADHGDAFGEHGYYEHPRYLHDEITHVPMLVRPPDGADGEREPTPRTTLDVAATVEAGSGKSMDHTGVSLLETPETDRTIFLQARGEDADSHLRRYALRTRDGTCFCERDIDTESVQFDSCTNQSLRDELATHVEERTVREHGETASDSDDIDEEIEHRLDALGYK